jgi:mycothiol synthase
LKLMWATLGTGGKADLHVRQVCLAVIGAGRTAVVFISGPGRGRRSPAERAEDLAERTATIEAACGWLASERAGSVRIVQSLPEPGESWAVGALEGAKFQRVGDLAYLRCPLSRKRVAVPTQGAWPAEMEVRPMASAARGHPDRALLAAALEATYEKTLDCPGLCGMRETEDVIDSHIATGEFDPSLWWLVLAGGKAQGCVLFNPCPDQNSVELVYLGVSPALRGTGMGAKLLTHGMSRIVGPGRLSVTCAVDRRNAPAIALYRRAGFAEFSGRAAYVRPLG